MEKRLGKGLGALIPEKADSSDASEKIAKIKISSIKPNKLQPRKKFDSEKLRELKDSIRERSLSSQSLLGLTRMVTNLLPVSGVSGL